MQIFKVAISVSAFSTTTFLTTRLMGGSGVHREKAMLTHIGLLAVDSFGGAA